MSDADALAHALFDDLGFAGNTVDYTDPENSYLDAVLDRRLGIPITLSVLMIEVGRRRGIDVRGVGMPGTSSSWPARVSGTTRSHGGRALDYEGCVARFAELQDPAAFVPAFLAPVGPVAILDRMLANLQNSLMERAPARVAWPTRLRLRIPGISPTRVAPSWPRSSGAWASSPKPPTSSTPWRATSPGAAPSRRRRPRRGFAHAPTDRDRGPVAFARGREGAPDVPALRRSCSRTR